MQVVLANSSGSQVLSVDGGGATMMPVRAATCGTVFIAEAVAAGDAPPASRLPSGWATSPAGGVAGWVRLRRADVAASAADTSWVGAGWNSAPVSTAYQNNDESVSGAFTLLAGVKQGGSLLATALVVPSADLTPPDPSAGVLGLALAANDPQLRTMCSSSGAGSAGSMAAAPPLCGDGGGGAFPAMCPLPRQLCNFGTGYCMDAGLADAGAAGGPLPVSPPSSQPFPNCAPSALLYLTPLAATGHPAAAADPTTCTPLAPPKPPNGKKSAAASAAKLMHTIAYVVAGTLGGILLVSLAFAWATHQRGHNVAAERSALLRALRARMAGGGVALPPALAAAAQRA